MEDTVSETKDFLKEINEMLSSTETNMNPKIVGNYALNREDVSAQIMDWVFHYLEDRKCPYNLAVAIAKETAQRINSGISEQQLKENSLVQGEPLNSHTLYNETIKKLGSVCKSFMEEMNENELTSFTTPYAASVFAIKNKRRKMEDRHVIHHDLNMLLDLKDSPTHSYYAVFDGHSGIDAASYASAHLHINIASHPAFLTDTPTAIAEGYRITDDNFSKKCQEENLKSGTTAVSALFRENTVYLSWLGDSQAVLVKEGKPVIVTSPHKPDREDERKRIEDLGGSICFIGTLRVNGLLAVTRALGDAEHKPFISSVPEMTVVNLDGTEDFLILACDGLWDGMSPEDVIAALYFNLLESALDEPLDTVAAKLVHQSKRQGSEDNITAVVIFLRDIKDIKEDAGKYIPNLSKANLAMNFLGINGEEKGYIDVLSNTQISKPTVLELNNSSTKKLKNTANVLSAAGLGDSSFAYSFSENEGLSYHTNEVNAFSHEQSVSSHVAPETTALSELPTPPIDDVLASEQFEKMRSADLAQELDFVSSQTLASTHNIVSPTKTPLIDSEGNITEDSHLSNSSGLGSDKFEEKLASIQNITPDEAVDIASSVVSNAIETAVKCLSVKELSEANMHVSTQKLNPYAEPFVMKSFVPEDIPIKSDSSVISPTAPELSLITATENNSNKDEFKESENAESNLLQQDLVGDALQSNQLSATDTSIKSAAFQQATIEADVTLPEKDPEISNSASEVIDNITESVNIITSNEFIQTADTETKDATNLDAPEKSVENFINNSYEQDIIDNFSALNLNSTITGTQEQNKGVFLTQEILESQKTHDLNVYNISLDSGRDNVSQNLNVGHVEMDSSNVDKNISEVKTSIVSEESLLPDFQNEKNLNFSHSNTEILESQKAEDLSSYHSLGDSEKILSVSSDLVTDSIGAYVSEVDKNSSLIVETSAFSETSLLSDLIKDEVLASAVLLSDETSQSCNEITEVKEATLFSENILPAEPTIILEGISLPASAVPLSDQTSQSCNEITEVKDATLFSENILPAEPTIILEGISLPLSDMKESLLSTAAVLPSDPADECHVEAVAVDLQTVPVGVPEAEGVTEDVDSDSEKDGGWSYMKGNTLGGTKPKAPTAACTAEKTTTKGDNLKLKRESSKSSNEVKGKIKNIASVDKSKKLLPEKKGVDVKDKIKVKSVPLASTKTAADKSPRVASAPLVKKDVPTAKVSTLPSSRISRAATAPRNTTAQTKSGSLPVTNRSQPVTKPTLSSNAKPKPLNGAQAPTGMMTSTPLPKKQPSTQSTKSNLATVRTTLNRPTSTVPNRALASKPSLQKPAANEVKARPPSTTLKRTIPSTLKRPDIKETKELANKQILEKRKPLPKASTKGLPATSATNTLKSAVSIGNKPISKLRSAPLKDETGKKDVPKAQITRLTAKSSAQVKLPKDTTKLKDKNSLPLQNKVSQKSDLKVEIIDKNVAETTPSEEEKFLLEVNDKEIPVNELVDLTSNSTQEQSPVENGCISENDVKELEVDTVTRPNVSLL